MMKNIVQCDHIVKTVNVSQTFMDEIAEYNISGLPLLTMEYCENGDLRLMLCKIENSNGLKESECRNVLKCLRNAVKALHEINITHRDIKPENIVIQNKNGRNIYKLTDLGYAKQIFRTAENSCVGTPGYYAPEIITSPEYSKRVDYWSMGVIGFEVICGVRPFIPHETLVKWMLAIKGKSSKVIAITENNKKERKNHEKIFNESQVSDMFKFLAENWLTLALEYDGKQRGSQFVESNLKSNTNLAEPPKLVFKFYSELDKIINAKILKIFCLTSYKFLSYIIYDNTTMEELKHKIEKITSIPSSEMYFIIPIESNVDQIKADTKPIDFFIKNSDEVMLYVTQINKICEKPSDPLISHVIQDVLKMKKDEKIEPFYFKEFIRHVVCTLRKEQLHYVTLLNGLKNYALNLNDSIEKNQSNKDEMKNKTLIAMTKVNSHVASVSHTRNKIEENCLMDVGEQYLSKWEQNCNKLQEETQRFVEAYLKVVQRFDSILRRSRKVLDSKILSNINNDQFEVEKYEKKYQLIRHLKEFDRLKDESESFQNIVYDTIRRRKNLLQSVDFKDLQTTLNEIHVEYVVCYKIILDSQAYLRQHDNEIQKVINEYHDELWEFHDSMKKNDSLNDSRPNLDSLLTFENSNEHLVFDNLTSNITKDDGSTISCFGETNDTKSLIEENDQISGAFEDLLNDLDQLLKQIS
ncbi:inhibitor of nuclear factor kappa-B kinase subunit beta isoform X2 [Condylostylus longicornis]|nr:inhibitor of nuclear factor kappa-B kinase subunit beta isoform X2 [Condylostylus longicornis]XP_055379638.1 inhibitor of nuclear factor kappa-B kinase subunit beta isoform X2 [Condylostylus longicornis]